MEEELSVKMRKFISFIFTLILTSHMSAFAADAIPESMKQLLKQTPEIPGISHIILSTLIMVVLIYVMAIAYHKLSAFNNKKFSSADDKLLNMNKFKLVNSMTLGANKSLHVVEINNKFLVVGSTPTSISLLKEFDKSLLMPQEMACTSEFIVEEPTVSELEGDEPWMGEFTSSKKEDLTTSAELDFEKIYKKYI